MCSEREHLLHAWENTHLKHFSFRHFNQQANTNVVWCAMIFQFLNDSNPTVSDLTYLLTPWCTVLLEKLAGLQLVKKFPAFYETHLLEIQPNIIHPSTPRSHQWSVSLRFPHQDPIRPLSSPIRATCPAHLILPDLTGIL